MALRSPLVTARPTQQRGSLVRTTVIALSLLALLPVIATAVVTYFRSRSILEGQLTSQLAAIGDSYSIQLDNMVVTHQQALSEIALDQNFVTDLRALNANTAGDPNVPVARARIAGNFVTFSLAATERVFDSFILVDKSGTIMASSDGRLVNQPMSDLQILRDLIGTQKTITLFNAAPYYPNQLSLVSSYTFRGPGENPFGTLIGFSTAGLPKQLLKSTTSFFYLARPYLITADNAVVSTTSGEGKVVQFQVTPNQMQGVRSVAQQSLSGRVTSFTSFDNTSVLAYVHHLTPLGATFIIEEPEQVINDQLQPLIPFTLTLLGITFVLVAVAVFLGTSAVALPMVQLAELAKKFAAGDLTQRTKIKRKDEIGMLALAFNTMAERLSELYRSMELKVEARTQQLNTASEVAQVAIAATSRAEMINQAVELITQRFDIPFAAIYLFDDTNNYLILQASSSRSESKFSLSSGFRVPLTSQTLVSWAASNNQYRIEGSIDPEDSSFRHDTLIPETRSAIVVPITLGSQVLGVLDVQSDGHNVFDDETATAFQTLASQIAIGLRTQLSLESAQLNLEETSLLYRTSRMVTQSKDEGDAFSALSSALGQTSYVTFLCAVDQDHLRILSMTDPKGGMNDSSFQGANLPLQKGITSLQEGVQIYDDLQKPSDFFNLLLYLDRRGCREAALLPITVAGQIAYVLAVGAREKGSITTTSMQPLASLTDVLGNTLDRFGVLKQSEARLLKLQTLDSINRATTGLTDLRELLAAIGLEIEAAFGSDVTYALALVDPSTNKIEVSHASEGFTYTTDSPKFIEEGVIGFTIRNARTVLIAKDPDKTAAKLGISRIEKNVKSWLSAPLVLGTQVIGAVILQNAQQESRFTDNDLSLLTTLTPQFATSIRNGQSIAQLHQTLNAYNLERFLLDSLLNNISDQVYFKDDQGIYLRASRSLLPELGLVDPAQVIGKSTLQLLGTEQGSLQLEEEQALMAAGSPETVTINDRSEPPSWRTITRIPLTGASGAVVGLLGITRDITEQKLAEQLSEQRSEQLLTAAEIARDTTSTLDTADTLRKAVNLVRDRFHFYHSSIFLVDPLGEFAVLKESTGAAGESLKQVGHKLAVGSRSIIGQTTVLGQPVVVNDVTKDPNYYPNPLLPETRAEVGIPLKVGDRVLGALDVQSTKVDAFGEDDINILQVLADQLAVAVINASLFSRTQEILQRHQLLHEITITAGGASTADEALQIAVAALHEQMPEHQISVFSLDSNQKMRMVAAAGYEDMDFRSISVEVGEGIVGQVAQNRAPVRVRDAATDPAFIPLRSNTRSELAVPILFGERILGVLNLESTIIAAYDENDQEILATLGTNLGSVLANIDLVSQIRLQVQRQKQLNDVTSTIRRSVDIESILQTSVNEIGRVMRARRATISVAPNADMLKPAVPSIEGDNGQES